MDKDYIQAAITPILEEPTAVRRTIAKDPRTRESILRELINDDDIVVRTLVYNNPNTPEDVKHSIDDILREYCVEVNSAEYWEWDFKYYEDRVCSNLSAHAVILSDNYYLADAEWWNETSTLIYDIEDYLKTADNAEDFTAKIRQANDDIESDIYGSFDAFDDADISSLYEMYKNNNNWIDDELIARVVEILHPYDLTSATIYGKHGESAFVIYDDEVDLDVLQAWLFGDIYELRLLCLDFDAIPADDSDLDAWSIYAEYGDEQESEMITVDEFKKLCARGAYTAIPGYYGLTEDECEVSGDI